MRSVFPFGGVVDLRFRGTCRQVTRLLSCGSSEREVAGYRRAVLVGPSLLAVSALVVSARSASRFSDTRVERGVVANNAFYLLALGRHCRVSPQRRVIGFLGRSCFAFGVCAGQNTERGTGGSYASGYRGGTRGWDSIIRALGCGQARKLEPEEPDSPTFSARATVPS
jgi:hypothetical protein